MRIREKLKQYGLLNFIKRILLGVLSRLGISIDTWLVCTQDISIKPEDTVGIDSKFQVKEMSFIDFESSKKFDLGKLSRIKERFDRKSFFAFGVYDKNQLAYYCWISLKEFQFRKSLYQMDLKPSEGLLFDAFCFPEYRGNKLHNFMNVYRLNKLMVHNKKEAVVILLSQNTPARKSQKRAGFNCSKVITTYSIFGKKGYYITNKKINL